MWSPFGVISVFCHYWSPMKVSIGEGFFCEVASPLGVVSSFSYVLRRFVMAPSGWWLRFYLACHCTCQYPSSPGFLCCLAGWLRCATLLYLWLCAHSLLGLKFPRLLACPSPSIWLLVCLFQWVLFSNRVSNLRDGVTPAGSRIVCPRSERRFRAPIWIRCTGQFPGWT